MSKIALAGNALGTGTLTIASPNTNTDRTLTLPDNSGTVLTTGSGGIPVNGPAFSAYMLASQSIPNNVYTKMQMNTELFDTNSNYDTTNYRFTPTVAGYYQVTGSWLTNGTVTTGQVVSSIYKNGVVAKSSATTALGTGMALTAVGLIYMNGTTDYLEFFGRQGSGSAYSTIAASPDIYYFEAFLARSAT